MAPPLKYRQPLSTAILVRLTPEQHDAVRLAVVNTDMSVADYVRTATILQLEADGVIDPLPRISADEAAL